MRANISYSVRMDDIPKEVSNICWAIQADLAEAMSSVINSIENKNYTQTRELFLKTRELLGDADIRLHDLDGIMGQYVDIINKLPDPEEEPEQQHQQDEV